MIKVISGTLAIIISGFLYLIMGLAPVSALHEWDNYCDDGSRGITNAPYCGRLGNEGTCPPAPDGYTGLNCGRTWCCEHNGVCDGNWAYCPPHGSNQIHYYFEWGCSGGCGVEPTTAPLPTPTPQLGRIQGRRYEGCPAGVSTPVTVSGIASYNLNNNYVPSNSSTNLYSTNDLLPLGTSYTVSFSAPAGYIAQYSYCQNRIDHPTCGAWTNGSSVNVTVPSQPAPGYYTGYVDLYWRCVLIPSRTPTPTATRTPTPMNTPVPPTPTVTSPPSPTATLAPPGSIQVKIVEGVGSGSNGNFCTGSGDLVGAAFTGQTGSLGSDAFTINSNGEASILNTSPQSPEVLQLNTAAASWINPAFQCQCRNCAYSVNTISGPSEYTFFVERLPAWWQTVGGNVGRNGTGVISNNAPSGQFSSISGNGMDEGVLTYNGGSKAFGTPNRFSSLDRTINSAHETANGRREDFAYFVKLLGLAHPFTVNNFTGSKPETSGTFTSGSVSATGNWTIGSGESYVIMIDGNLGINTNITVAPGGFLAFIVKGSITISPTVTQVHGIYIADHTITTVSAGSNADSPLQAQGMFIGWGLSGVGVDLNRDLADDSKDPAEKFVYRPDLLLYAPDSLLRPLYEWREVAPQSVTP